MMDIDDGYILWTGIWKALGHSKADIVKMIDSQPDLAPLIRRVRGGYLKIQGTWMPYEVALRLSRRVAYNIREDLIPLFGPTFPTTCLSPDQPGYGQVVTNGTNRRRTRRATHSHVDGSSNGTNGWTVVTPNFPNRNQQAQRRETANHGYQPRSPSVGLGPPRGRMIVKNIPTASPRDRTGSVSSRYSPYIPPAPYPSRLSPSDNSPILVGDGRKGSERHITLPPVQVPLGIEGSSSYALPPISAMEDLRGIPTYDSAAVLRRLKSDDNDPLAEPNRLADPGFRIRRRSFSSRSIVLTEQRHASFWSPRHPFDVSPPDSDVDERHPPSSRLSLSVPSNTSADGNSTCDPSPISPATPRSVISVHYPGSSLLAHGPSKDCRRVAPEVFHPSVPTMTTTTRRRLDSGASATRRHSDTDSDTQTSGPHRPW